MVIEKLAETTHALAAAGRNIRNAVCSEAGFDHLAEHRHNDSGLWDTFLGVSRTPPLRRCGWWSVSRSLSMLAWRDAVLERKEALDVEGLPGGFVVG